MGRCEAEQPSLQCSRSSTFSSNLCLALASVPGLVSPGARSRCRTWGLPSPSTPGTAAGKRALSRAGWLVGGWWEQAYVPCFAEQPRKCRAQHGAHGFCVPAARVPLAPHQGPGKGGLVPSARKTRIASACPWGAWCLRVAQVPSGLSQAAPL